MNPVNIVLWCPSCWFEMTNNYSYFSGGLDIGFTLVPQPYFKHVTYE